MTPRELEQAKYPVVYKRERYRMSAPRMKDAVRDLEGLPCRGSYLDIGCGRGEMIKHALRLGFMPAHGVEVVPSLIDGVTVVKGEAHDLPFGDRSFDVVSLFDVIEHLIPGDDHAVCREMVRVAKRHILLTANNKPSIQPDGTELHINKRPYAEWDDLFRQWFPGKVIWIKGREYVSEGWRIDL